MENYISSSALELKNLLQQFLYKRSRDILEEEEHQHINHQPQQQGRKVVNLSTTLLYGNDLSSLKPAKKMKIETNNKENQIEEIEKEEGVEEVVKEVKRRVRRRRDEQ